MVRNRLTVPRQISAAARYMDLLSPHALEKLLRLQLENILVGNIICVGDDSGDRLRIS